MLFDLSMYRLNEHCFLCCGEALHGKRPSQELYASMGFAMASAFIPNANSLF